MADENGVAPSALTWPLPEFYFNIEISNAGKISCKEVSGLDIESDAIEYRAGSMPGLTKVKMPGLCKSGNVTLKKAIFKYDKKLRDWITQVKTNTIRRESVTVTLLDESGSPMQSWKLTNAWSKKYTEEGFMADGNDVSMETIVLAHEGVTPA